MNTPEQHLLLAYRLESLRCRETHFGLGAVEGKFFKTAAAARGYRATLPPDTAYCPSLFGVYAVEGGYILRRFERDGVSFGAIDPNWVDDDAAEAERQRTARRAAFMARRGLTEDEHGNFVECKK